MSGIHALVYSSLSNHTPSSFTTHCSNGRRQVEACCRIVVKVEQLRVEEQVEESQPYYS